MPGLQDGTQPGEVGGVGRQAQPVIESPLPPESGVSLADTRAWAPARLDEPLTLADLAAHANTSVRTLTRRFHAETSLSPLQWLLHQRVDRARELLETTALSMELVAHHSGIGTTDSLRKHLVRRTGLTPSGYRAAFTRIPADRADVAGAAAASRAARLNGRRRVGP